MYVMTSLPSREWDWSAALDSYDGSEESNDCCGFGSTEIDSIKDLLEKLSNVEDIKQ
jgi:hypothetical protein